jgi:hypothetical protein
MNKGTTFFEKWQYVNLTAKQRKMPTRPESSNVGFHRMGAIFMEETTVSLSRALLHAVVT